MITMKNFTIDVPYNDLRLERIRMGRPYNEMCAATLAISYFTSTEGEQMLIVCERQQDPAVARVSVPEFCDGGESTALTYLSGLLKRDVRKVGE